MSSVASIILAAGQGTRMKSTLPKVLHPLAGRPILSYVIDCVKTLGCSPVVVVVGYQGDRIREVFPDPSLTFVTQAEQLGSGHAVQCAEEALQGNTKDTLILCGDSPLIRPSTLQSLVSTHQHGGAVLSILTARFDDPTGYGRVIRDNTDKIRVVEEKDATPEERSFKEINSGTYCVEPRFLFSALSGVDNNNAQGEYYLTDIVQIASGEKKLVLTSRTDDPDEIMGINTRDHLARAEEIMRLRSLK